MPQVFGLLVSELAGLQAFALEKEPTNSIRPGHTEGVMLGYLLRHQCQATKSHKVMATQAQAQALKQVYDLVMKLVERRLCRSKQCPCMSLVWKIRHNPGFCSKFW